MHYIGFLALWLPTERQLQWLKIIRKNYGRNNGNVVVAHPVWRHN